MLVDPFGRKIDYLRISVTDKCNYRCVYCMPPEGIELKPDHEILGYEDITAVARCAGELGIERIRLTGGEPLVRRGIESLVAMLSSLGCFGEICMTTNGSLLTADKAGRLKDAGLSRVNISLDTLDPQRFGEITRGGRIEDVIAGIDAAIVADLAPVKINMIVFEDTSMEEIALMRRFCEERELELQTIKHFSLYGRDIGGEAGELSFDRPPPCETCNRLRLTTDGFLKPCLFSDIEIRADLDDLRRSITRAVSLKPLRGTSCINRKMCQIGG